MVVNLCFQSRQETHTRRRVCPSWKRNLCPCRRIIEERLLLEIFPVSLSSAHKTNDECHNQILTFSHYYSRIENIKISYMKSCLQLWVIKLRVFILLFRLNRTGISKSTDSRFHQHTWLRSCRRKILLYFQTSLRSPNVNKSLFSMSKQKQQRKEENSILPNHGNHDKLIKFMN